MVNFTEALVINGEHRAELITIFMRDGIEYAVVVERGKYMPPFVINSDGICLTNDEIKVTNIELKGGVVYQCEVSSDGVDESWDFSDSDEIVKQVLLNYLDITEDQDKYDMHYEHGYPIITKTRWVE